MDIVIYGSKEYARLLREQVVACGHRFVGFIDDQSQGPEILGSYDDVKRIHPPTQCAMGLGIGYKNLAARAVVLKRIIADGYDLPALVHPRAYVASTVKLGAGVVVMATASVDHFSTLEDGAVLWPSTTVSHDSIVRSNVFLSPGVTLCGFTEIGSHSFIGASAIVADHRRVPENSFVKAGTLFK